MHRGGDESAGRAAFVVANDLEKIAMINFGAPNWFWALLLVPLLIFLFVRAEKRATLRLRSFVSDRLLPNLARTVDRRCN